MTLQLDNLRLEPDIAQCVRELAHGICWRQWRALTGDGEPAAAAIVDPEMLMLLSFALRDQPGIGDMLAWWARAGSRLLNLQRLRALLRAAPPAVRGGFRPFAAQAAAAGDRRFDALGGALPDGERSRASDGPPIRFAAPAALMLRLRSAFGIGNKADLLAFALGNTRAGEGQGPITLASIAQALSCSIPAARRATAELGHAGLLTGTADRPTLFALTPAAAALAGDGVVAPWRDWVRLFTFLVQALEIVRADGDGLAERLLRLARGHRGALVRCDVSMLQAWTESGGESLLAAQHFVVGVADWMAARV